MPTDLGYEFPPEWNGRPLHMGPNDRMLWFAWFPSVRRDVERMWFDVAVGPWPYIPPLTSIVDARMWARLNQKRIDAVLERAGDLVIVELRWDASSSAIGRLLMYRDLWLQDDPVRKPVKLWLVSNKLDPAWQATARSAGIEVLFVPMVAEVEVGGG